jgi:hypothetical protein
MNQLLYNNVIHLRLSSSDQIITSSLKSIIKEIDPESYESFWYTTDNWNTVNYSYCDVLFEKDTLELISLNGNNIIEADKSLKILGRFYVMKDKRKKYRSIQQVIIIPHTVEVAKQLHLTSVWYNIHCFDKRHQRYSTAQKRLLNGGQVDERFMPYWKHFKFVGEHMWNGVLQDKFEYVLQ